jgi:hypothetical protein
MAAKMQAQTEVEALVYQRAGMDALRKQKDGYEKYSIEGLSHSREVIAQEAAKVEAAAKRMSRIVAWAMWWPILGAGLICLALLGLGLWGKAQLTDAGVPSTGIIKKGVEYEALTGKEWTTCNVNGQSMPCRPVPKKGK